MSYRVVSWTADLAVGEAPLDNDHAGLIDVLNEILIADEAGLDPAATQAMLVGLIAATREHFAKEEAYLAASGYPHLDKHRREHARLLAEIDGLASRPPGPLTDAEASYLRHWVLDHIVGWDRAYAEYLARRADGAGR